ncbi:hypothetical protein SAMN06295888_11871 [Desulfonatronum zhilinae]|nr:hypothetical protein SAMN06295888_11871 [Desulfonatronum zhilinae]
MISFLLVEKRIRNQLLIGIMPSDPKPIIDCILVESQGTVF